MKNLTLKEGRYLRSMKRNIEKDSKEDIVLKLKEALGRAHDKSVQASIREKIEALENGKDVLK